MNNTLKFSIIIPIYNTESYLKECIESVLSQTYTNLEVILVNDGSPDNSENICNDFVKKDNRVRYYEKKNEGVAIARNFGISKASGDYIFCLDSDDYIEKQFIEKIVDKIKNNTDLVIIGKHFCRENVDLIGALPTSAFAVNKKFLNKYPKVRFIEHIQPCEDGLFSYKLLVLAKNIAMCPNAIYYYRQRVSSSEHNINQNKIVNDIPLWFKNIEDFHEKYQISDREQLKLISFIYNEPYRLRFKDSRANIFIKLQIFNTVNKFLRKHSIVLNDNRFGKDFKYFINSSNFFTYWIEHIKSLIPEKLNIAYCWQCRNVGDDFNVVLLKKIKKDFKRVNYDSCDTMLVGSNLDNVIIPENKNKNLIKNTTIKIIGTGFIEKEKSKEVAIRNLEILAIRGYLSFNRIANLKMVNYKQPIFADPGILASELFPIKQEKKYDLGIIPHYNDKNCDMLFNKVHLNNYNFKFIDVQQDCYSFFNEINKCRCILSSSLHGLIFADSYNIPNRQILLSDKVYGDNYKFKDYYSAYKLEYKAPLDLRDCMVTDSLVDQVIKNYHSINDLVYLKQRELLEILNTF